MGFFHAITHPFESVAKAVLKPVAKLVDDIPGGNVLVPIALQFAGVPAPVTAAALNYGNTGNVFDSLKAAGLAYAGSQVGNAVGGSLGTVGSAFGDGADVENTISSKLGNFVGSDTANTIGADIATTGIGKSLGQFAGNSISNSLSAPTPSTPSTPAFTPSQADAAAVPASLSSLSTLTLPQQASNVATQGVYGGGNGPDEQSYFANLVNRQLVDKSGNVSDISTLDPIEKSYLSQLGLGQYSNSNDLLKAMSTWSPT